MAITKIHAIKATVSGAINYICNEDKTDSSLLISYFGTTPKTAADDFKFTLSHTDSSDPNKAFHLIQSFAPGEVSAEEALRTDSGFRSSRAAPFRALLYDYSALADPLFHGTDAGAGSL